MNGPIQVAEKSRVDRVLAISGAAATGLLLMYYIFAGLLVAFAIPVAIVLQVLLIAAAAGIAGRAYRPAGLALVAAAVIALFIWGLNDISAARVPTVSG